MIDVPDLDLRKILCDMFRDGIETGTMTFTPQGHKVPSAAIVFLVGPSTQHYLDVLEEAEADFLFNDVWPH